jgi:hypothetical protein
MHQIQIQTKASQLLITQINQGANHLISQGVNPSLEWAPNVLNEIQGPQPMFQSPTVF